MSDELPHRITEERMSDEPKRFPIKEWADSNRWPGPLQPLVTINVAMNEARVAFLGLDMAMRRVLGLPPSHYNPPPMFGLRRPR